jgi:large subunit ribosomal protein L19e
MKLDLQKRLARDVLNVGVGRIWFDPDNLDSVKEAITRADIKSLVNRGIIKIKPKKGVSRVRSRELQKKKRRSQRRGVGSRKGRAGARTRKKEAWMSKIRAIRKLLQRMREKKVVDSKTYRDLYRKAKGGFFRDRSHVKLYVTKLIKKKGK